MTKLRSKTMTVLAMALAGTLFASPALADKPAHAGGGKPDRHQAAPGDRGPGAKADRRDDGPRNNQQRVDQRERPLARQHEADARAAQHVEEGGDHAMKAVMVGPDPTISETSVILS